MTRPDCTAIRWFALALLAGACAAPRKNPAPNADLLVSAGDSTYWVTSDASGVRLRGVPMVIARVDGRFHELYVADDDRSFPDALFVGQRLYSRDLVRGDSVELMADTVVPRLATEYANAHPRVAPLAPDEDASDDPSINATADIELLDVHGPYVSFEYHSDVETHDGARRSAVHRVRRGVLDSRTAAPIRLAALVGEAEGARAESVAARRWALVRDSLAATAPAGARSRLAAIAFDPRSFSIEVADRAPQAVFAIPSESRGESPSSAPTLSPQPMREGAWWSALRPQLPAGPDSLRRWSHDSTTLVAQIENESARLILRDATGREWKVGVIAAPVQRVVWLDATVDAATRKALQRAFSDASLYSESTRIAASPAPARGRAVRAALATRGPSPRHEHRRARVPRRQRMAS